MRRLMPLLMAAGVLSLAFGGCREESKIDVSKEIDSSAMPTMTTHNVATLISDSGITQYKIVSPLWLVYDQVDTPYWSFPEGLYLQKFDKTFNVIATVAADSAKFFTIQKLWRLDGNVEMKKAPDDLFLSPRVFWNQRRQIIYSDTFIHIENDSHVIEGTGFESNEHLTQYRILHPNGIFPVNQDDLKPSAPSAPAPATPSSPLPSTPVSSPDTP